MRLKPRVLWGVCWRPLCVTMRPWVQQGGWVKFVMWDSMGCVYDMCWQAGCAMGCLAGCVSLFWGVWLSFCALCTCGLVVGSGAACNRMDVSCVCYPIVW